jgi:CheY-like chemotaxis protein
MSRTILLADDSLTIQKVVELTFADTEYEVVSLSSGDDLLQKLDEVSPDLVICDIIMPGRDGYEVCQEIKSDPATLHIPVILLSGTFEPFDRDRALAAGCSDIITKPFEARKLVETVEKLLAGEASTGAAAVEVASITSPETLASSDPDMQTLESIPAYVDEAIPAAAETTDAAGLPESSLDFTDTGFAEMEEAAVRQREQRETGIPDEGLDFEFSDEHEAFGSPDTATAPELPGEPQFEAREEVEIPVEPDPFAEPETTREDEAFRDLGEIPEFEDVADSAADTGHVDAIESAAFPASEFETTEEPYFEGHPGPEAAADIETGEPLVTPEIPEDSERIVESFAMAHEPFASDDVGEPLEHEEASPERTDAEAWTAEVEEVESFEVSPETIEITRPDAAIEEPVEELPDDAEHRHEVTVDVEFERDIVDETDIAHDVDVSDEPDIELQSSPELPQGEQPEEATPAGADTGPVPAELIPQRSERVPDEPFRHPEPVLPGPVAEIGRLSDEDVDRIAHRVLELASDRFDQLAWEIVPDMAEIAVRQRIRELEVEIEGSSDDDSR